MTLISKEQMRKIHVLGKQIDLDHAAIHDIVVGHFGVSSLKELTADQTRFLIDTMTECAAETGVKEEVVCPHGDNVVEILTVKQREYVDYLVESLAWDATHFENFCRRTIKKSRPRTKREATAVITGLFRVVGHGKRKEENRGKTG